ncbi:MAG: hypothetical protein HUU55_09110 [Myxococcales bacterium]|nr:hypothetical protein [Myxococcales bacterium]
MKNELYANTKQLRAGTLSHRRQRRPNGWDANAGIGLAGRFVWLGSMAWAVCFVVLLCGGCKGQSFTPGPDSGEFHPQKTERETSTVTAELSENISPRIIQIVEPGVPRIIDTVEPILSRVTVKVWVDNLEPGDTVFVDCPLDRPPGQKTTAPVETGQLLEFTCESIPLGKHVFRAYVLPDETDVQWRLNPGKASHPHHVYSDSVRVFVRRIDCLVNEDCIAKYGCYWGSCERSWGDKFGTCRYTPTYNPEYGSTCTWSWDSAYEMEPHWGDHSWWCITSGHCERSASCTGGGPDRCAFIGNRTDGLYCDWQKPTRPEQCLQCTCPGCL